MTSLSQLDASKKTTKALRGKTAKDVLVRVSKKDNIKKSRSSEETRKAMYGKGKANV